ncbi:Auxin Efflux Carrier [Magnetococcus marinus MC-1]|uniref:Auxin Efflux Carrier n=1 Tax=Magnetococcus marinus (strain ATCC BAA-1437 / JCM 17883 / MC-1) TaxID=156889 RepID=A0L5F0_MAGMM|nr:AEC family transporter [Magnetococcus marinus]ABK43193.1 Auxin Efflux Carrier [Magnetococcus marinus MC-1]
MLEIVAALGPVFLLVLAGVVLNLLRFPGDDFWPLAERFVYFLLFPALLIRTLGGANFNDVAVTPLALSVVVPLLLVTALMLLAGPLVHRRGAGFTSVYQGAIRFNTYVALSAAEQLFGEAGLALAAMTIAWMIPLINILCVGVFALKIKEDAFSWRSIGRNLAHNPLIVGCTVGLLLNISGIGLPGWLGPSLNLLGQPALPLGLLAVGVGLHLHLDRGVLRDLGLSALIKFMLMPLLVYGVGRLVGLQGMGLQIAVLFFAMPTASSAYILAKQMGGDAPLMAKVITGQTLLAMLTLPLTMALVSRL